MDTITMAQPPSFPRQPDRRKEETMKITALYERLSRDDEQQGESNSIQHQKVMLEDYARKSNLTNICHFTDDGVSGTRFDRPAFQAMIAEVEAGNVGTVICKDLSRIGRDYLRVGFYTEVLFAEKGVRFIAVHNNVDSAVGDNEFAPFMNIMAEWYARDTSRKIKAVFKSRMENGQRCSGAFPYGYLPDPGHKGQWVIDEEAAAVVRRVFRMVIEGQGVTAIARALRTEQVPIPSEHWKRLGVPVRSAGYADPYAWSPTTVGYILNRPEYMGKKVLGKTVSESYKSKKHRRTTPEERHVFDGAVPVIVDEETWHNAQRLRRTVRRPPKREGPPHRLTGLLYCADCGAKLTHRDSVNKQGYRDNSFVCGSYRQLTRDCTMHYISSNNIEKLILSIIRRAVAYAVGNEAEFAERVRGALALRLEASVKTLRRKLSAAEKRCGELNALIRKCYESNASGKLPDKHFQRLLADYDAEQSALEERIATMQSELGSHEADSGKAERFLEVARRYTDFTKLTTPMVNEFVEKIVVHEADKSTGERVQRVDVYLSFIGNLALPEEKSSPEELTAAEKRRRKNANERVRRHRAKKKAAASSDTPDAA